MIVRAFIVPHPPIILPEIGRGEEEKIQRTTDAFERVAREIAVLRPDTIIVSSPHAPMFADRFFIASGAREAVSLRAFGFPHICEKTELDAAFAETLSSELDEAGIQSAAMPAQEGDHGFLIPMRFIHQEYRDFKVVHVGISYLSYEKHRRFGACIARASRKLGRRCVYIASGDLSHVLKADGPYGLRPEGPVFDAEMDRIFRAGDLEALFRVDPRFAEDAAECGLRSFQIMAGALEGRNVRTELYSHEGPFGVGYAVASVIPEPERGEGLSGTLSSVSGGKSVSAPNQRTGTEHPEDASVPSAVHPEAFGDASPKRAPEKIAEPDGGLPAADMQDSVANASSERSGRQDGDIFPGQDACVALARASVESYVRYGRVLPIPEHTPKELLSRRAGAFVTLCKFGELRGCIGTIVATRDSLAEEIIRNAVSSSTEDPRFPSVGPEELDDLEISVDVLGGAEPIDSPDALDPKRYGVIVSRGFRRGLLLPDLEGVDTPEEQIEIARRKAGIGRHEPYSLERFEVIRHCEKGKERS